MMPASEASEKKYVLTSYLVVLYSRFVPLILMIFLAEHKIRCTRTICTFVGVPRTRVRRTEYPLKRSESGVPKRGGIASIMNLSFQMGSLEQKCRPYYKTVFKVVRDVIALSP